MSTKTSKKYSRITVAPEERWEYTVGVDHQGVYNSQEEAEEAAEGRPIFKRLVMVNGWQPVHKRRYVTLFTDELIKQMQDNPGRWILISQNGSYGAASMFRNRRKDFQVQMVRNYDGGHKISARYIGEENPQDDGEGTG